MRDSYNSWSLCEKKKGILVNITICFIPTLIGCGVLTFIPLKSHFILELLKFDEWLLKLQILWLKPLTFHEPIDFGRLN